MLPSADKPTEIPKSSPGAAWEAVSSAVWDQVPPRSLNTYAAPVFELRPGAPTRAVVPRADTATEEPNTSNDAPWEAVSSAVWARCRPAA